MHTDTKLTAPDTCPIPVVPIPCYMTWIWGTLAILCWLPIFANIPFYSHSLHGFVVLATAMSVIPTLWAGRQRIIWFLHHQRFNDANQSRRQKDHP